MTAVIEKKTDLRQPSSQRLAQIDESPLPIQLLLSQMPKSSKGQLHSHQRGQLIYPCQGRYCVHFENKIFKGAAWQATWIPPQIPHTVEAIDALCVHNVYIDTQTIKNLPEKIKSFKVSILLSELLNEGAKLAQQPNHEGEFRRLTTVIADQIRLAQSLDNISLPLSMHPKIRLITEQLSHAPDDKRCLNEWARLTHVSPRTLSRLFIKETGLSFSHWRQRLYAKEAIDLLSQGQSVLQVSIELGYSNQSAFTQMFRRTTGCLPSDFVISH